MVIQRRNRLAWPALAPAALALVLGACSPGPAPPPAGAGQAQIAAPATTAVATVTRGPARSATLPAAGAPATPMRQEVASPGGEPTASWTTPRSLGVPATPTAPVEAGAPLKMTPAAEGTPPPVSAATMKQAQFRVPTISCPSCVKRVEANAKKDPGVVDAKADLSTQIVIVTYDPAKTDPAKIAEAIRAGGDEVEALA